MILIKSNDIFNSTKVVNLFEQKKISITKDKSSKYFFELNLLFEKNQLKIDIPDSPRFLKLPISFELFFSEIKKLYVNKSVTVGDLNYNPIKQSLSFNKNSINLNYIHNIIMTHLTLNLNIGINKSSLYKLIWPYDKDIQINKLDTHITNLKNKVKEFLKIDLTIISNTGIIKLIID